MRSPTLFTILFGLAAGIAFIPANIVLSLIMGSQTAFCLYIWIITAAYSIFLARTERSSVAGCFFPLLLLFIPVFTAGPGLTLIMALVVLSWIRSGGVKGGAILSRMFAELVLGMGGAILVTMLNPGSAMGWSMGIWFFFLVQSLYFLFIPEKKGKGKDSFEKARQKVLDILQDPGGF